MNRSEIKSRILMGCNDSGPTLFTSTQLNDLIDESAEFVTGETHSIRRSSIMPLRDGITFYSTKSVADDVMLVYRIWNETQKERLAVTSLDELDKFQERWINTQGQPEYWFPVAIDLFGVYPTPASAGGIIRVDYLAWPGTMTDDTEEPELTITAQNAMVTYGSYMGLLKAWDTERAVDAFKTLQGNDVFAKAKSGINRISHRSLARRNLDLTNNLDDGRQQ